jgi:hypothetical protein
VVDAQGRPVAGWIEIAPYRKGERTAVLYPPNLHRQIDGNGEFPLPMPSEISIVRATREDPVTGLATDDRTPNVLLDPLDPPPGKLELVLREPIEATFEGPPGAGLGLEVLDELGLVVETRAAVENARWLVELPPGRYRARLARPGRAGTGEASFELIDRPVQVALP